MGQNRILEIIDRRISDETFERKTAKVWNNDDRISKMNRLRWKTTIVKFYVLYPFHEIHIHWKCSPHSPKALKSDQSTFIENGYTYINLTRHFWWICLSENFGESDKNFDEYSPNAFWWMWISVKWVHRDLSNSFQRQGIRAIFSVKKNFVGKNLAVCQRLSTFLAINVLKWGRNLRNPIFGRLRHSKISKKGFVSQRQKLLWNMTLKQNTKNSKNVSKNKV